MNIFLSTWILLGVGLLFALPMIYLRVRDHTDWEEETLYARLYFGITNKILLAFLFS